VTTPIKPLKHQAVSLKHGEKTPIVLDLSDAGTGKTFVRVAKFAKRRRKGGGCLLVIAPRSLLRSVWLNDFKKFAPDMKVSIANAANREKAFAETADVYVTNPDAAKWLAKQKPAFFKKFDEVAVDESTVYKHHTSQRSKAVAKITKHFKFLSLMTATPTTNSITDIWHQVYLLDGGRRLGNSFYKFRESVCVPKQVGRDAKMVQWTDREGAEEAVFTLLSDIVIRHRFEDCVDIPPNHQYSIEYELTPKQIKTYNELAETQMLWLSNQNKVTAINAAAVAQKLLQIASGAVYDGTGKYEVIDTARYELVLDLVEQRKHSLVIFQWKHQRDLLIREAESRGISFAVLDGESTDRERDEIVQGYQAGVYRTLFGHPKTIAHGYTLTKGTATIWAGPTHDLEHFIQGSKRQHRIGQTQKTETIVVVAAGTVDENAYANMRAKNMRQSNLLDLFTPPASSVASLTPRKKKAA
jgi:SNF2 family DNA or RNA helicase